jgi:hypothetical protein
VTITPVSGVSPEAVWTEVLEDFVYLDEGVPVRKRIERTNRGTFTTFEVLADSHASEEWEAPADDATTHP